MLLGFTCIISAISTASKNDQHMEGNSDSKAEEVPQDLNANQYGTSAAESATPAKPKVFVIMLSLCMAVFLIALDVTIVTTALCVSGACKMPFACAYLNADQP